MKTRKETQSDIQARTKKLLEEIRIVLPGTQALVGFLFTSIFSQGFDNLSMQLKYIHLGSLGLLTFTTILLLAPAAYDRLIKLGSDVEHFHTFSSRMVLTALLFLGLGLSLELYVVVSYVTNSSLLAETVGFLSLGISYSLWFGYTLLRKNKLV